MLGQQQQQRPEVPAPLHPQAMLQQQQQPMPEPTAQTGSVQLAGATTAHPSSAATAQTQALPTQQAASQVAPLAAPAAVTSAVPVITSGINAAAGQPPQLPAATAASPSGVRPATSVSASDPRLQKVGFAKLLGDGVEYYIRKYEIVLGRKSKVPVDVVLGDSAVLSRQHCRIVYNFQAKKWQLVIEGKNGVSVNGVLHTPTSGPYNLVSQDLLQAGDVSLYFLLPKQPRKPKSRPAVTTAADPQAVAQNNDSTSCVPDIPALASTSAEAPPAAAPPAEAPLAAAAAASQPAAGSSPTLPPTAAQSPMLLSPRTATADAGAGLQPYQSGPLLPGLGLSNSGPLLGDGFGAVAVQVYSTGAEALAANQDLLQPGLGDEFDDGMMEV